MPILLEHKPERHSHEPGQVNHLAELREVYEAIDDDDFQTEVFNVEGSNAAVRYRRMKLEERLKAQGAENAKSVWERNAQFLIEAHEEVLWRDPETGTLEPAAPGLKITFDWREDSTPLHEALGVRETDVRRSVLRLFKGVDEALLKHAEHVDNWMASAEDRTRQRFSGG